MTKRRTLGLGLLAGLGLVALAARAEAPAAPASAGPASAAPASAAPASAVPASAVAAPAAPASLDSDVPGPDRSKAPTAAEWLAARPVKLTRQSPKASACAATRVREWIRVRCASKTFAISLLGGSTDGLSFWIGTEAARHFGEVQLPLRRGDRRVVQIWATRDEPSGASVVEPSLVLQELWVEGDAAPTVTVL